MRERSPFGPAFDSGAHLRGTFPHHAGRGTCRVSAFRGHLVPGTHRAPPSPAGSSFRSGSLVWERCLNASRSARPSIPRLIFGEPSFTVPGVAHAARQPPDSPLVPLIYIVIPEYLLVLTQTCVPIPRGPSPTPLSTCARLIVTHHDPERAFALHGAASVPTWIRHPVLHKNDD